MKKSSEASRIPSIALSAPISEVNPVLDKVLGSVHTCIAILDTDFNFLFVNQAYAHADQKEPEEILGRNHFDLYPNDENEAIFRRVVETRQPYFAYARPFVYPYNEERGITYWDWSLQAVVEANGDIMSLVLMLQDVTEREQASQELAEQQQLLARVFSLAPDANLLVDSNGKIITVNHQIEQIFGYRTQELIGQPVEILLPERFRKHHKRYQRDYFSHPFTRPMGTGRELVARKKNGKEFPAEIMLSPLNTSQGMVVLTVIRDISRKKETEAELTEMRRLLLIGLENERLQLAQNLHDSAIQELYGMLYQFQMLREDIRTENMPTFEEVVEGIKRVNNRLRATCSELYPSTLIPFGLKKSILSYAYRFQEAFPEIDLNLELDDDGQSFPEELRLALYRIFIQLLTNVVEHADAHMIWVSMKIEPQRVMLTVQDDGRGFSVPKRWITFARSGRLGLVDITERAHAMGGRIEIESKPGSGTVARAVIPYRTGPSSTQ